MPTVTPGNRLHSPTSCATPRPRLGFTPAQTALRLLLHSSRTLLIPARRNVEPLVENADAARVELDDAAMAAFDGLAASATVAAGGPR